MSDAIALWSEQDPKFLQVLQTTFNINSNLIKWIIRNTMWLYKMSRAFQKNHNLLSWFNVDCI